jgi:YhcH/YjgK/YiaL family protein
MIKDSLHNFRHFIKIRPAFEKAFEYLAQNNLAEIPDGHYDIDDKKIYAVISHSQGKGVKNAKLEAHTKYIDIQFVIEGKELIGISRVDECKHILSKYDEEKDIIFYSDKPQKYIKLKPGEFVIFFPNDAHAPLAEKGIVHKVVIKVAVE